MSRAGLILAPTRTNLGTIFGSVEYMPSSLEVGTVSTENSVQARLTCSPYIFPAFSRVYSLKLIIYLTCCNWVLFTTLRPWIVIVCINETTYPIFSTRL